MYITLRNGKKYRRPDGKPICWMSKENKANNEVEKEETATPIEEGNGLSLS